MKEIFSVLLSLLLISSFSGCSNNQNNSDSEKEKKNDSQSTQSKEYTSTEKPSPVVTFKEPKSINESEFKIINEKAFDINNDGVKDKILLLGKGELHALEEPYILIKDGKTQKNLSLVEGNMMQTEIIDVYDLTGDGILDIIVGFHTGGKAGSGSDVYEFKDGEFIRSIFEGGSIECTLEDNFSIVAKDSFSKTMIKTVFNDDTRKNLQDNKVYNSSGTLIDKNFNGWFKPVSGSLKDIKGNGKKQFVSNGYLVGTYTAQSLISIDHVYIYENGKFILEGILDSESTNKNFVKYTEEDSSKVENNKDTTTEDTTSNDKNSNTNSQLSSAEASKILRKALSSSHSPNNLLIEEKHEKSWPIPMKFKEEHFLFTVEDTEAGYQLSFCYAVNKKTKKIFAIPPDNKFQAIPYESLKR